MIHDGIFTEIRPLHEVSRRRLDKGLTSHAEKLASLLPELRNQYMHGIYQFHPDYLHLAIQVREMADTLTMPRVPSWKTI